MHLSARRIGPSPNSVSGLPQPLSWSTWPSGEHPNMRSLRRRPTSAARDAWRASQGSHPWEVHGCRRGRDCTPPSCGCPVEGTPPVRAHRARGERPRGVGDGHLPVCAAAAHLAVRPCAGGARLASRSGRPLRLGGTTGGGPRGRWVGSAQTVVDCPPQNRVLTDHTLWRLRPPDGSGRGGVLPWHHESIEDVCWSSCEDAPLTAATECQRTLGREHAGVAGLEQGSKSPCGRRQGCV